MLLKIVLFLAFLIAYAGFFQGARLAQRWMGRFAASGGASFAPGLVVATAVTGALTLFLYLLARFFNPWLLVSLLLVSLISLFLGLVVRGLMGSRDAEAERMWESFGWGARSSSTATTMNVFMALIVLGFPVAAGIVYFSNPVPSPDATLWMLRLTLLGLLLGTQLPMLLYSAALLAAETVEDDARTLMLAERVVGTASTAFLVALALWSFGIVERGGDLMIGGVLRSLSPIIIVGVVVYFVVTSLVPYLIGSRQSANWRRAFFDTQSDLRSRLLDALDLPDTEMKLGRLRELLDEARQREAEVERDQLVVLSGMMERGEIDETDVPKDFRTLMATLGESFGAFRQRDPRFQHLGWLQAFTGRVQEIIDEIESKKTKAAVMKVSQEWADYYRKRTDPGEQPVAPPKEKSKVAVVVSFLVSTGIFGTVLSKAAEFISRNITQAAGQ